MSDSKMTYERPNIAKLEGYTPGEQPSELNIVKLNTNENPFPPPEPVLAALRSIVAEQLRRYPPPMSNKFQEAAAKLHGVSPDQIILTNGGDELLRLLLTTFVDPGEMVGVLDPSYSLYNVLIDIQDAKIFELPLSENWEIPEDTAQQMNAKGVKLLFVVNPHAPSGTLTPVTVLDRLAAELKGLLVIDEAYVDFVDPDLNYSTIELVKKYPNVIILRSLSKGYSLAGMRCGYGIGPSALISPMNEKTKDSYNMNIVAQVVATASLEHRQIVSETWTRVREERTRVTEAMRALGLHVPPSQSNFILATVPPSFHGGAASVFKTLQTQNIHIRYFSRIPQMQDKLRCTIGTPAENNMLLAALQAMK